MKNAAHQNASLPVPWPADPLFSNSISDTAFPAGGLRWHPHRQMALPSLHADAQCSLAKTASIGNKNRQAQGQRFVTSVGRGLFVRQHKAHITRCQHRAYILDQARKDHLPCTAHSLHFLGSRQPWGDRPQPEYEPAVSTPAPDEQRPPPTASSLFPILPPY